MREIKFRAWDKKKKEMIDMDNPTYSVGPDFDPQICDLQWFFGSLQSEDSMFTNENNRYALLQFTGLKDRHGKEIYEGDLLKNDYGIYQVYWYQDSCSYVMGNKDCDIDKEFNVSFEERGINKYEVIGNIYKNPELYEQIAKTNNS